MARMELRDVSKSYGAAQALCGINLKIADGEFVVLIGPPGSGKSTLLRVIAGLEPITSGDFLIDDQRMNDVWSHDRDIAMVYQPFAPCQGNGVLSRRDSTDTGDTSTGTNSANIELAAVTLGLKQLTARLPRASSGEGRRPEAVERAFLIDAPRSGVDGALRLGIAKLHHRLSSSMIYATHDQVEALTLADRIVVLNAGKVQQTGSPTEIYQRPANKFVAQFVGSPAMNVIPVRGTETGIVTRCGARIALPLQTNAHAAVELGIRPEHLDVVAPGTGDMDAIADVVVHQGADTNIYANVKNTGAMIIRKNGNVPAKPGDLIGLRVKRENAHVFAADGASLQRHNG